MSHTTSHIEEDFFHCGTNLKKKNIFYRKQFALLGFACIPSTITVDYMSLKMSSLPCNPLSPSVWFSREVIILCLCSKPVAMEINVMLQICYYLWLHCRMDPNEKLIFDFFTKYLASHMKRGEGIRLSFLNWEVEVLSLVKNTNI